MVPLFSLRPPRRPAFRSFRTFPLRLSCPSAAPRHRNLSYPLLSSLHTRAPCYRPFGTTARVAGNKRRGVSATRMSYAPCATAWNFRRASNLLFIFRFYLQSRGASTTRPTTKSACPEVVPPPRPRPRSHSPPALFLNRLSLSLLHPSAACPHRARLVRGGTGSRLARSCRRCEGRISGTRRPRRSAAATGGGRSR